MDMLLSLMLSLPDGLEITAVSASAEAVVVQVISQRSSSCCPVCSTPSSAIHSYYRRKPADLPCAGRPLRLLLTVRKFFCRVASCSQKVFTERLPAFLEPCSRLTTRLRTAIQAIGFASTGKAGARLAAKLGMPLTDTTLLWSLHLLPVPVVTDVQKVGIDDWAWRRGQRYGTLLVDLERHQVIELLADRSVTSAQNWFEAHPDIELVSRDRGGIYAEAATAGVPLATQVADRWHLCKNIGDAVEAFLIRTRVRLPEAAPTEPELPSAPVPATARFPTPRNQRLAHARLQRKWEVIQRVQELHQHGASSRQIARQLDLARNTVLKYVQQPAEPPVPTPRPRRTSRLDPYEAYLLQRWNAGCQNAAQLFQEIQAQGYPGCKTMVRAYLAQWRTQAPEPGQAQPCKPQPVLVSPREMRWLLARKPEDLDQDEQGRLERLLQTSAAVQAVYQLLQTFLTMVRQRQHEHLRPWMAAAVSCGVAEMKSFVVGIERDYEAVEAALRLPWSQGQTEGQVNKLKTLKRMMYGRAGFALLRVRMLHRD
jgi:transposase